jgi:hypothetical protein
MRRRKKGIAAMSETHTGGCLRGGVRFETTAKPGPGGYCHCADCRRVTGSAFNVSVAVKLADFRITKGKPKGFAKTADSGNELTRWFCGDCGSPLYTASPAHPDTIYVKAGALDDPSLVAPGHQSWTQSRVGWSVIPPEIEAHARGSRDG